jgi:hypothetical protein
MKKLILIAAVILMTGITYGQTLQKGALLGLHTVYPVLSPGVSMDQYLSFLKAKLIPAYEKSFPGLKCYLLKSKRGECVDCIILVFFFQSEAIRDKYFKPDGDYTDLGLKGKENMQSVSDEMSKMDKSTEIYTDYVIQ